MDEQTKQAIRVVKEGGIVVYPTDTAFGIGCRIDRPQSVDRLFSLRKRPVTQATPVLVSSREMALAYLLSVSDIVRRLMDTYWPGALTVIAACDTHRIYSPIRGGGPNIGLRMPDHTAALELIAGVGVPVLGPSANFHGGKTPYELYALDAELVKLVDFVLPGECVLKLASTVIDTTTMPATVVRAGALSVPASALI